MLQPKEKAKDLVEKFGEKLAIICVNEILKTFDCTLPQSIEYWQQVKEEILKLNK